MIANKPTILIYAYEPKDDILKEVSAGIEEEGVLYEIVLKENSDIQYLTSQSAENSVLGSGIGISEVSLGFTLKTLPEDKLLFYLEEPTLVKARILGANAARAVKRMPFKEL